MCDLKEQRTCLKFCFLLGKTPTESLEMLQEAFKEQALSRARVFEWFSRFKKGDLSIEDQPCSGRPSSSRNDENITKIHENSTKTIVIPLTSYWKLQERVGAQFSAF